MPCPCPLPPGAVSRLLSQWPHPLIISHEGVAGQAPRTPGQAWGSGRGGWAARCLEPEWPGGLVLTNCVVSDGKLSRKAGRHRGPRAAGVGSGVPSLGSPEGDCLDP